MAGFGIVELPRFRYHNAWVFAYFYSFIGKTQVGFVFVFIYLKSDDDFKTTDSVVPKRTGLFRHNSSHL